MISPLEKTSTVIGGATVSGYSFEVVVRSGHSKVDVYSVEGKTKTGTWEVLVSGSHVNGISFIGVILADPTRYVELRYKYTVPSGHWGCILPGSSGMKYSTQYIFN